MKRKINLFSIVIIIFVFFSRGFGEIYEYPVIYKDPRIMASGGANIALGGYNTSVLYNPASISLNKKNKYIVDVFRANLSFDKNGLNFFNDIQDAVSVGDRNKNGIVEDDRLEEVINVINKYTGKSAHAGWDALFSVSKTGSDVAYSFGLILSTRYTSHIYNYSHSQGVVDIYFDNYIVPFAGMTFNFFQKKLSVGFLWKYMFRRSTKSSISAREISYKGYEIDSYVIDDLGDEGRSHVIDLGLLYRIPYVPVLRATVGLSMQNIGNPKLGDLGKYPQTINVGFGINPDIKGFKGLKFGIDFVDITKNIDLDKDIGKRTRYGLELNLINNPLLAFILRAGVYQGYFTTGIEARLAVIDVIFTTYAEELGLYSGQNKNRRYIISAGISW